jgi:hypothetical protein
MKIIFKLLLASFTILTSCTSDPIEPASVVTEEPTPIPGPLVTIPPSGLTPCANGQAGVYPCLGYDLQALVSLETMVASSGNDSWGWTDTQTGK